MLGQGLKVIAELYPMKLYFNIKITTSSGRKLHFKIVVTKKDVLLIYVVCNASYKCFLAISSKTYSAHIFFQPKRKGTRD